MEVPRGKNSQPIQFLVLAPNEWTGQWMNRQQLFSRIGRNNKVCYGNGAYYSWERNSPRFKQAPWRSTHELLDNVHVFRSSKTILRWSALPAAEQWAIRRYCRKFTQPVAASDSPKILYLFHPEFLPYIQNISHDLLVYHAYDDFSKQGDHTDLEDLLIERADLLLASSRAIKNSLENRSNRQDIHIVPNGVDFDHFATLQSEPPDLAAIPHPRIGYIGSVNQKVDIALYATLADILPMHNFIIIGNHGVMGQQQEALARAKKLNNIHFLEAKSLEKIPAYMQYMDINAMPYVTDETIWASSGYPLKLHEYLAVGKPVISSAIDAVLEFEKVVSIPRSVSEWKNAIEKLVNGNQQVTAQQRQAVAKANQWNIRAEQIQFLINEKLNKTVAHKIESKS